METYKIKTAATTRREICVEVSDTFDLVEFLDNEPANLPAGVELLDAQIDDYEKFIEKLYRFNGNDNAPAFCFIYHCDLALNPNYNQTIYIPRDFYSSALLETFDDVHAETVIDWDDANTIDFNEILTLIAE
jgi:hypothetical protein